MDSQPTVPNSSKYSPRQSARRTSGDPLAPLEIATLIHVGVFVVAATWAFGGNDLNVRPPLLAWGSLSVIITLLALRHVHQGPRPPSKRRYLWLIPFLLFNAYVVIGLFNPSQTEILNGSEKMLLTGTYTHWLPSTARPRLAAWALWAFDTAFLSAFNLAVVVRRRRALRGLLLVLCGNATALAVFGTLQKLAGAKGLFFGLVHSPNPSFFSTFIYHNHWGAYILLSTAAALGLFWHYLRRGDREYRDVWHSPAFVGAVGILLLSATIPLSSSRSSTLLLVGLLGLAFIHGALRAIRSRRGNNESPALPLAGIGAILVLGAAAILWLANPVIRMRWELTKSQVTTMERHGTIGSRIALYRDTLAMAKAQPIYGWGMGSYPTIFYRYNTAVPRSDNLPIFYADAHSDWLQAFAELGLVGSALIGLCGLLPLFSLIRGGARSLISRYLLAGCAIILLYAWVEFPLGDFAVVIVWWVSLFSAVAYASLD